MSEYKQTQYWIQGRVNPDDPWHNVHVRKEESRSYFDSFDDAKRTIIELLRRDVHIRWEELRIVRRVLKDDVICSPVDTETTDSSDLMQR